MANSVDDSNELTGLIVATSSTVRTPGKMSRLLSLKRMASTPTGQSVVVSQNIQLEVSYTSGQNTQSCQTALLTIKIRALLGVATMSNNISGVSLYLDHDQDNYYIVGEARDSGGIIDIIFKSGDYAFFPLTGSYDYTLSQSSRLVGTIEQSFGRISLPNSFGSEGVNKYVKLFSVNIFPFTEENANYNALLHISDMSDSTLRPRLRLYEISIRQSKNIAVAPNVFIEPSFFEFINTFASLHAVVESTSNYSKVDIYCKVLHQNTICNISFLYESRTDNIQLVRGEEKTWLTDLPEIQAGMTLVNENLSNFSYILGRNSFESGARNIPIFGQDVNGNPQSIEDYTGNGIAILSSSTTNLPFTDRVPGLIMHFTSGGNLGVQLYASREGDLFSWRNKNSVGFNQWYRSASREWISFFVKTSAASYQMVGTGAKVILADATNNQVQVILPSNAVCFDATASTGNRVTIKKIDASINPVRITPGSPGGVMDKIDGVSADIFLYNKGEFITIQSTSEGWVIIGKYFKTYFSNDTASVNFTKTTINAAYPNARAGDVLDCKLLDASFRKKDDSPTGDWFVISSNLLS